MQTCKNCGHRFEGKFCNNCGQTAETHKNRFSLFETRDSAQFFISMPDFCTQANNCLSVPDIRSESIWKGKRIKHIQPLSFILILAGFYILLCHWFHLNLFTLSSESASRIKMDHDSVNLDEFMLKKFWLAHTCYRFLYMLLELIYVFTIKDIILQNI